MSLPQELSQEIRDHSKWMEEGWGQLKATAQIEDTKWESAIWFDTKRNTYVLPLKAEIRKKRHLKIDQSISLNLWI